MLRPNVIVATAWWPSFEPCAVGAWGVETRCSLGRLFLPLVPPEWIAGYQPREVKHLGTSIATEFFPH